MWIVTAELDTVKIQNVTSENASPVEQISLDFDEDEHLWFVEAVYFPVTIRRNGSDYLYTKRRRMAGPFESEDDAFGFIRGLATMLVASGRAAILEPVETE